LEWRWKAWPPERPLYGLRKLAERSFAKVCVVEGEKSADAAQKLLPDCVTVTSPNGSDAADKADWSPLRGRDVIVWPDADSPGDDYAQAVSKCVADAGAKSIAVASPPSGVDEGWDAANALEEGWTPERAAELIAGATLWTPMNDDKLGNTDYTSTAYHNERGWRTSILQASDLQEMTFPPAREIVPGYIPEGATLLVGKPKIGAPRRTSGLYRRDRLATGN
jgi:DNA primase